MTAFISDFHSTADEIAEYLRSLPALEGVEVIVPRQQDIESEVNEALSKALGLAVIIVPTRGAPVDQTAKALICTQTYVITVVCIPVMLDEGALPATRAVPTVMTALHHWTPAAPTPFTVRRLEVVEWSLDPDDAYLIYNIRAEMREAIKAPLTAVPTP